MFKTAFIRRVQFQPQVSALTQKLHLHSLVNNVCISGKSIHFIRVDGADAPSTTNASPAAPAVLLMPGALGSVWTDFRPQVEKLPALLPNWTIVAWDPPGYGRSVPPKRTFPRDFFQTDAADAYELMRSQGFEKFSLLGWSDGGITAMILAAAKPEAVDKLVVWGGNSYVLPEEIQIYESIRDVKKWSPKMRQPMEEVYGVEGFAQLWKDWVDGITRLARSTEDGDICKKDLPKIRAKTLVLHGAKDPMVAAEHAPYLLANIRDAQYFEFPDGKHNIHLRYAEEFNRIVADFLNQN